MAQVYRFTSGFAPLPKRGSDEEYIEHALAATRRKLQRMAEQRPGGLAKVLGPADRVGELLVEALPMPSGLAEAIGPVYRQASLARRWGISRQAVSDMAVRRAIFTLLTGDGRRVVPAFQFDAQLRPLPGLVSLLAELPVDVVDEWTLAVWLCAPQKLLDGRTVIDALRDGRHDDPLVQSVVRAARDRWAR